MRSIVPHKATKDGGPETACIACPKTGSVSSVRTARCLRGKNGTSRQGFEPGTSSGVVCSTSEARGHGTARPHGCVHRIVRYRCPGRGCCECRAAGQQSYRQGCHELGLLVSLEIATTLLSVITRSHHNDITHTNAFHDLVFDTVNSLHLQLNLRMSEGHTCQLQQGHIPIGSAQCMVVGCISYCPNPFWLSLAQRRARHF